VTAVGLIHGGGRWMTGPFGGKGSKHGARNGGKGHRWIDARPRRKIVL